MTLTYLPVHFFLRFAQPVTADTPPLFVLRSVLGKNLRAIGCIAPQNTCPDCMYNRTCAYAFLFETVLPAENSAMPGRDRASHPFVFTGGDVSTGKTFSSFDFTITLAGQAVEYLPYIHAAFVRAGQEGLFKERTPFKVTKVSAGAEDLLQQPGLQTASGQAKNWHLDEKLAERTGEILVELKSPLRFKYGGAYGIDFSAQDFFRCLYRRARTLCLLYGSADNLPVYTPGDAFQIAERRLVWQDYCHYSARQKKSMNLGGVLGSFKLRGSFTAMEQNLLEFSRICNAGKNTNFGFGQLDYWVKWE